jgi:sugar phosphate isomerase/epimerase
MTMFPSACTWLYRTPAVEVLHEVKAAAFHYVDLECETLDVPGVRDALSQLGLKVSCVALDHNLPPDCSLEGNDPAALRKAIEYLKPGLDKCAAVGARAVYVTSCRNRKNLRSFGIAMKELAELAALKSVKFCVEHAPKRALSTAREALTFVEGSQQPNLHLLLDIGHTLISGEKSHEIVTAAGRRLGSVQLNDNDGKTDRHWALLDGRLRQEDLAMTLEALGKIGYDGTLGLELANDRASVGGGLSRARNLLLRMQLTEEAKSLKEPEARRKK